MQKPKKVLIFSILYLLIVLFTHISLTGFWTDVIFSIIAIGLIFKNIGGKQWLVYTFITIYLFYYLFEKINPFISDTFLMRSFYFQNVDGRLFNAYFKPVGAYSGGQGNFWITESPKYFPIIEKEIYYERAVLQDFGDDTFEGEPIDNYQEVKNYIKREVIDKQK